MSSLYLCYTTSKQEIAVRDELRLLGCEVTCPLVLEGKLDHRRAGRKRPTIWTEKPALMNYLWARMTPHQFHESRKIKNLHRKMDEVSWAAELGLRRFEDMADKAYREALRAKRRGEEPPPAFDPDEALEIIGGPLAGLMAKFQRIIEDADGYHVEVDTDLTKKTRVSPAHVRKAG
jgi:transcription antitermination factor NusG